MQSGAALGKQTGLRAGNRQASQEAACIGLECELREKAEKPFREVMVDIPLRTESGALKMMRAWRVLHSNSRGPAIGEFCFDAGVTREQVLASAAFNTWAAAVAGVPFGGSFGVIACDGAALTEFEREVLIRRYISCMHHVLGPYQDVMMVDEAMADMASHCMLHEFGTLEGLAALTAKKPKLGGLPDFQQLAASGVVAMLRRLAEGSIACEGLRIAIRGTQCSEGAALARAAHSAGCRVVALSDSRLTILDANGLDVPSALKRLAISGTLATAQSSANLASDIWNCDCDVLVAMGSDHEFTPAQALDVKAAVVVEASRGLMTQSANALLEQRGVVVIPDLLVASTKIAAAHEEWAQNLEGLSHERGRVEQELERIALRTLNYVQRRAVETGLSLRAASYELALERVARMEKLRGL